MLFVLYVFDVCVTLAVCVDMIVDNLVDNLTDSSGRLDMTDRIRIGEQGEEKQRKHSCLSEERIDTRFKSKKAVQIGKCKSNVEN